MRVVIASLLPLLAVLMLGLIKIERLASHGIDRYQSLSSFVSSPGAVIVGLACLPTRCSVRGDRLLAALKRRNAALEWASASRRLVQRPLGQDVVLALGLFGTTALAAPVFQGLRNVAAPPFNKGEGGGSDSSGSERGRMRCRGLQRRFRVRRERRRMRRRRRMWRWRMRGVWRWRMTLPHLGLGVAWRPELALWIDRHPGLGFVEIIAEDWQGPVLPVLDVLRERGIAVIPHGISLSLGSAEPPDPAAPAPGKPGDTPGSAVGQ